MTPNEARLVAVLQDAVDMLKWQAVKPLGAASWGAWIVNAHDAMGRCQNAQAPGSLDLYPSETVNFDTLVS